MRGFHKFLGITSLILSIVLIIAISFTGYYISKHKDILSNFGNLQINDGKNLNYNWSIFNNNKSSQFETVTASQTDNFSLSDSIVINSSLEDVIFVEEDRTDIMVEYYNEHPSSPLYSVEYKVEQVENTLYINTYYSVTDIFIDREYDSYIKVHVPTDYVCNTLDLTLSMGEITNQSIFGKINNLYLTSSLGNIDLDITTPKESISVHSEMGDIDLRVSAPVTSFDSTSNFGEMSLDFTDIIESLVCELDMGSLDITAAKNIEVVNLTARMGEIVADFNGKVANLNTSTEMGNVDLSFANNKNSTAYIDSNMGNIDIDSSFSIVKESDNPDLHIYSSFGNVSISSK
ncbi:MAG: hypothetical protein CVU84_13020 [Firmicutes bacterium HGW-Firmicutes-1]|jgi:hypothetical protein|nr:MAG: hypothetical protein CVU84_13020 [Firmicutes bacterium HGW-Firmicutes-1]